MNALLLEHFDHPRGQGGFEAEATGVIRGQAGSEHHGAVVRFDLKCTPDGRIEDAMFKAWGCSATIACASMVVEWSAGKSLLEAALLSVRDLVLPLDLAPERLFAPLLVEDALRAAVAQERKES